MLLGIAPVICGMMIHPKAKDAFARETLIVTTVTNHVYFSWEKRILDVRNA